MDIKIPLPAWAFERHLRVFAGIEEVARKLHGRPMEIKVGRCSMCGGCCKSVARNWAWGRNPDTGDCAYLVESPGEAGPGPNGWAFVCGLRSARPQSCATGDGAAIVEGCTIKWESLEDTADTD